MGVKLLCTGDVHLGRRPSRLPDCLDPADLGPAAVWAATVGQAIEREVDAVVLTGDVVDEDNRFFEAYGPLADGVRRLLDENIPVYAVAGNHDFDVFRRLADEIEGFRLLGRDGRWDEAVLDRDGQTLLRLIGWSFPSGDVRTSPLSLAMPPVRSGIPTVGLLHCDCDAAAGTPYAPVTRRELADAPVEAWLLGHIHKPQIISESGPMILYPGSPQGLHVNETGPHGPWLVEIEPPSPPTAEQLPLATLRWEHINVPLDDMSEPDAFDQAIARALKNLAERIRDDANDLRAVGCRLRLTGRTAIYRDLDGLIPRMQEDFTESLPIDGVDYFIDSKVENDARPNIPFAEWGSRADPAGLLARRLGLLDSRTPADEYDELIDAARNSISASTIRREFEGVTDRTLGADDDELAATLLAAGARALDTMLAGKEARE